MTENETDFGRRFMKAYLKTDPTRLGEVIEVTMTGDGQSRMTVLFDWGVTIDADVNCFEVLENKEGLVS